MGIRMLNRRMARAQASAEAASAAPPAPVPAFAARASTARIPTDLVVVLRRTATHLRRRLRRPAKTSGEPSVWRLWAGLGRSYLTALIARTRHTRAARATRTIPVFIVTTGTFTRGRDGGAGH
ncbi:hypothetical protein [Streptomyces sp. NBC_00847]|uniref:hypothetical protein n=1 Tax=unclassified Streptomyces TaxID=2593676 RepID=UPI00225A992D|nr:hypothetical protein [Streptomyces sp. NBC_00847]MCX4880070.1 hypothetical protein [Streptomyces sp. NBC_00847]